MKLFTMIGALVLIGSLNAQAEVSIDCQNKTETLRLTQLSWRSLEWQVEYKQRGDEKNRLSEKVDAFETNQVQLGKTPDPERIDSFLEELQVFFDLNEERGTRKEVVIFGLSKCTSQRGKTIMAQARRYDRLRIYHLTTEELRGFGGTLSCTCINN